MKSEISADNFEKLTLTLIEKPITHVWRGHGTAIFIEFGRLTESSKSQNPKGEYSLMIEWSWRVESKKSILFGSFSEDKEISDQLQKLKNNIVTDVSLFDRIPEICIGLNKERWIKSFATQSGNPQWTLFLPNNSWCYVENSVLYNEK